MEELSKKAVKVVKKAIKAALIPILIPLACIVLIIAAISSFVYFLTIDDVTYKEGDWSSTPYVASEYADNLKITTDGKIASNYTIQELWDKMNKNKSRVGLYLNGPREMLQMMYAEVITQLPDLREDTSKIRTMDEWKETFDNLIEEDSKYQTILGNTSSSKGSGNFEKYKLSDEQLKGLTALAIQEQGSTKGAAAEASIMANLYEKNGSKFKDIVDYVLNGGWFANAQTFYNDTSKVTPEALTAVKSVLVEGKRTLPKYVDEHDCKEDIVSATNDGVAIDINDNSAYIQHKTRITNKYGATYTFYSFPAENSDPFGYLSAKNREKYGDDYYEDKNTSLEESGYKTSLQGGIIRLTRNLVTGETIVTKEELQKMETDYDNYKDDYELKQKAKEKKKKEEEEKKEAEQRELEARKRIEKDGELTEAEKKQKQEEEENEQRELEARKRIERDGEKEETEDDEESEESEETEEDSGPLLEFEEWMKQKGYTKDGEQWKRKGSKISMTYVSPEKFEEYINAYKNNPCDDTRNEALAHFTLEKGNSSSRRNSGENTRIGEAIPEDEILSALAGVPDCTYEDLLEIAQDLYDMDEECFKIALGWAAGEAYSQLGDDWQYIAYLSACIPINDYATGDNTVDKLRAAIAGNDTGGYYSKETMFKHAEEADEATLKSMYLALKNPDERPWACNGVDHYSSDRLVSKKWLSNSNYTGDICVWTKPKVIYWKDEWNERFGDETDVESLSSMDGVLFVGDSITEGLRQEVKDNKAYTISSETKNALKNSLFRSEVSTRPSDWLKRIKAGGVFPDNSEVNAVCVMLGTNAPTEQSEMKQLIDELCKKYSGKKIYVQKLLPRGKNSTGFYYDADKHNELMKQYNKDISAYCKTKDNVYFIDATNGYVLSNGYLDPAKSSDGCHLDKDRETWAKNLISIIAKEDSGNSSSEDSSSSSGSLTINKNKLMADPDFSNDEAYKGSNPYYPGSLGQCVWFAWGKFYEIYGFSPGFTGNGVDCAKQLVEAHPDEFELSETPAIGAVFSYNNHVGIVVDVDGENIVTQEGNVKGINGFGYHTWEEAIIDWENYPRTVSSFRSKHSDVIYANPKGATLASNGKSSSSTSNNTQYNIKIATFQEVTTSYSTNDPSEGSYGPDTEYTMTTETINYYDMVKAYTMPFEYLWTLLVTSEDRGFVFELLRTIYESDIEITVNDNLDDTTVTTTNNYTITEVANAKASAGVTYTEALTREDVEASRPSQQKTKTVSASISDTVLNETYQTTKVVRTVTNTVDIAVTRANIWIVDYTKDFVYKEERNSSNSSTSKPDENEKKGLQDNDYRSLQNNAASQVNGTVERVTLSRVTGQRDWSKHNQTGNIHTVTFKQGYEEGESNLREKTAKVLKENKKEKDETEFVEGVEDGEEFDVFTDLENVEGETKEDDKDSKNDKEDKEDKEDSKKEDDANLSDEAREAKEELARQEAKKKREQEQKEAKEKIKKAKQQTVQKLKTRIATTKSFKYKEKNFVTLLSTYYTGKTNILNIASWVFELLEKNEATVEMVDLTKYLLYKVTDDDRWGITEFDFSIFEPGSFSEVDGICGNTPQEKVWYAVRKAGFSEEAAAGVLGNIENESGFDPSIIEGGSGIGFGLAQWSFERRTKIEAYAKSKGASATDIDIQIEFLIAELTPGGGANGYAQYQMSGSSSTAYDGKAYTEKDFKDAKTPEVAAMAFMALWERPSEDPTVNHLDKRKTDARKYYNQFKGRSLSSFEGGSSSSSGKYKVKKDSSGRVTELVWDGSPEYIQWDPNSKWANTKYGYHTAAKTACGPTSTAIALETLLGKKVSPAEVCEYALTTGHFNGRFCSLGADTIALEQCAKKWGVKSKTVVTKNTAEIEKALKEGKVIVANVWNSPWCWEGGHFICIMGYKNGQTYIRDPNNKAGSGVASTWYNLQSVVNYSAYATWVYLWK